MYHQISGITFIVIVVVVSHSYNFFVTGHGHRGGNWNNRIRQHGRPQQHQKPTTYIIVKNDRASSCAIPTFPNENNVQFSVDECQGGQKNHPVCQNGQSAVPSDWTGTMKCSNGSFTVIYSSKCSNRGEWNPPFHRSCAALTQQYFKKFPESTNVFSSPNQQTNSPPVSVEPQQQKIFQQPNVEFIPIEENEAAIPCFKLQVQKDSRFIYSCLFPGHQVEVEECGTEGSVPSGTQAFLRCRPPYQSRNGGDKHWICENGKWNNGPLNVDSNNGLFLPSRDAQLVPPTTQPPLIYQPQIITNAEQNKKNDQPMFTGTLQSQRPYVTTPTPTYTPIISHQQQGIAREPEPTVPIDIRQSSVGVTRRPESSSIAFPNSQVTNFQGTTTPKVRPILYTTPTPIQHHQITAIPVNEDEPVMCPPLSRKLPGVRIVCVFLQNHVATSSCEKPVPIGSEARYSCDEYYEATVGLTTFFRKCKEGGTWSGSSDHFACIVNCGRSNIVRIPLITHGTPSYRGQWPWSAAIFVNESRRVNVNYNFICGGTLISHKAIVTAAHCVTEYQSTVVRNRGTLRVDLGKYKLHEEDDKVQSRTISKILVHPSYSPYGYDSDIAILILDTAIKISYHVSPVCFPQIAESTVEELQLSEDSLGTVAGWGQDESGNLTENQMMTVLPVVNSRTCLENIKDAFATQIQSRSTTFCAGFSNGTNVCNGDSGSGMYFPTTTSGSTRWYLQGVVSVGIPDQSGNCDPKKYSIFTRVGRYSEFIVRTLSEEDAN